MKNDPRTIETKLKTSIDFSRPQVMASRSFIVAFSESMGWTEGKCSG